MNAALSVNAGDANLLRLGADFYIHQGNHRRGADYLGWLAEVRPQDASLLGELGHEWFLAREYTSAERNLTEARRLGIVSAVGSEDLARHSRLAIRLLWRSAPSSTRFSKQSKREDLWLLRADAGLHINDWRLQADSLEHALAVNSALLDRRTTLRATVPGTRRFGSRRRAR